MKVELKDIIETQNSVAGRLFDAVIQTLIILSILSFSIETLPSAPVWLSGLFWPFEVFTVVVFTLEYGLRLFVAERRWKFVFSFYGLVDLAAIAPFYLASGVDLRAVRALRLLRLFKLFRYSAAIRRFGAAFGMIRHELVLYGAASLVVLYLAAAGIYIFEHEAQPEAFASVFHSLWWAIATLTTVGYGEVYPITAGGKFFTAFILVIGLGIISVPSGLLASALTKVRDNEND